ncbi:uncharacterized protein LOC118743859 [Rhagoletis pomonella]|uniref:uncharacterized protein LOC118743859 n=1 Tax=Rhagoletis pomonella TaxID=28610 RepID=UPI00177F1A5E|nr:uncharacterized protein LOC118743859 [Rhagoletis pomonella]
MTKILAVFREWSSQLSTKYAEAGERLRKMKDQLTMNLSSDNYATLVDAGKSSEHAIDPDNEDHQIYLSKFKNRVFDKSRFIIEEHITNDPDVMKGRRKAVQHAEVHEI